MEDSKGILRGECKKCSCYCIEYNRECIADFPVENIEECIKKDICAICDCPSTMHKEYTFKTTREKEAYENVSALYKGYNFEKALTESVNDTERLGMSRENFTYGEISFLSFPQLLALANPKEGEVFYDLGCGSAKPTIYASFLHDFAKCVGVELLPSVCNIGKEYAKKYEEMIKTGGCKHTGYDIKTNVQVIEGNFLEVDFSEADIIYLPSTVFNILLMKDISRRCQTLKPGTRIITLSKPLPCLSEESCNVVFNVYNKQEWVMSWGLEPVYYQTKE